jgi:urease accessory protein
MLMTRPPLEDLPSAETLPRYVRAHGGVRLRIGASGRGSVPLEIAESAGYRVRFLRGRSCEGVFINTGGGMAGGDTMALDIALDENARTTLTTQAAEKIYRAQHDATTIDIRLNLAANAGLAWLPQEQIIFDGARLDRRFHVDLASDAELALVESVVFGREAMGESVASGSFRDSWRVRRGGRLIFADEVRLDDEIAGLMNRGAIGGGARAMATCLFVSPDAEALVEPARAALADASCSCGATAFDGMLLARFLGRDAQALRSDLVRFLERLRGEPVPRSWKI